MQTPMLFFIGLLVSFSINTHADKLSHSPNFSGKYFALAVGGNRNLSSVYSESKAVFNTSPNGIITTELIANNDLSALTGAASFYAGVAKRWNDYYIAVQLGTTFSKKEIEDNTTNKQLDVRNQVSYELSAHNKIKTAPVEFYLDVKPGLIFSETLYYGIAGLAVTQLKIEANSQLMATNLANGISYLSQVNSISKKYSTGARAGIGVETAIKPNFSFSLAYIYTYYGTQSTRNQGTANGFSQQTGTRPIIKPNGLTSEINHKLSQEQLLAGIHYYSDIG